MSEDLIRRSDAIKELAEYMREVALQKADGNLRARDYYLKRAEDALRHIPTIEPKRGRWIDFKNGWKCNACGKWNSEKSDFCPNCGARMKGADDE